MHVCLHVFIIGFRFWINVKGNCTINAKVMGDRTYFNYYMSGTLIKHAIDIEIFSKESELVSLRSPPQKGLYILVFDCLFYCDDHDPKVWCDILNFKIDRKVLIFR